MYEEAEHWLIRCTKRRPDDLAVWRARLKSALATNRVMEVRQALKHLPVAESTPAEVPRLAAWLAGRREDRVSERRALDGWSRPIQAIPPPSSTRRVGECTQPGRRCHPIATAKDRGRGSSRRFLELHKRYQPARDAAEMAALAQRLGRRFEARAFMTLAVWVNPDRDDLRRNLAKFGRLDRQGDAPRSTLAEALEAQRSQAVDDTFPASAHDLLIPSVQPSTLSGID